MGLCGNCSAWQDDSNAVQMYQADPDIAGIGTITVYVASAFITLCLEAVHLILTISDSATNSVDRFVYKAAKRTRLPQIAESQRLFWVPVIKKLVLSLSDQQLLAGLAVLIAGFWTHCSISVYHFSIVNDLAWFSAQIHLTTLSVLEDYFLARPVFRNWRVALIVALALLLAASTIMEGHYQWYDGWPYDAQCLFDELGGNIGGAPGYWMRVNLALIFIFYPLNVIPLFNRPADFLKRWFKTEPRAAQERVLDCLEEKKSQMTDTNSSKGSVMRFGCKLSAIILFTISQMYFALLALIYSTACDLALSIFWFGYGLWSLIEDRKIPPSQMNGSENTMSFGQIVPILLLSSTVLVFREAYDDQKQEMENKESLRSQSSQLSLVRVRSSKTSIASTPTASQTFEMTGATQDSEDDREPETFRPRRTDTEMGGRSQSSRFSPVDTRGATMAAATTSQVLGTTVAAQDGEADGKLVVASLQQVDTEVGERSQASGLESGDSRRQPQRRPTFPQMAGDQPAQEDIANDLSEGR